MTQPSVNLSSSQRDILIHAYNILHSGKAENTFSPGIFTRALETTYKQEPEGIERNMARVFQRALSTATEKAIQDFDMEKAFEELFSEEVSDLTLYRRRKSEC